MKECKLTLLLLVRIWELRFRATVSVVGDVAGDADLGDMVDQSGQGRCAITLDPAQKLPGQQPYQGVVALAGDEGQSLGRVAEVLRHYMLRSEQLDTFLVLAADDQVAAGLLIQRLPVQGVGNLAGRAAEEGTAEAFGTSDEANALGHNEHFNRVAHLASTLTRDELLGLDAETILRRLFWEEQVLSFTPLRGETGPRFACTCSRERVRNMIRSLGADEAESILSERDNIEVACEFCGQQYRFDAVDAAQIFTQPVANLPPSPSVQ